MKTAARFIAILLLSCAALAEDLYQKPPKEILDVLNAPLTPLGQASPARDYLMLITPLRYPPIADLAQPMLRIAGLRINPVTNGQHTPMQFVEISLVKLADGSTVKVALPPGAKTNRPEWSPDGKHFAFTNTAAAGIELWIGEAATARARRLGQFRVNAAFGDPIRWMPDSRTLLVNLVPAGRGKPPEEPRAPKGPNIQESEGKVAPVRTFQDLLKNPHDEALFDYYAASQLAFVDRVTGETSLIGKPAIYQTAMPSPDGKHLLVARVHRPYSYLLSSFSFPRLVEIWDRAGKVERTIADLPLADAVPIEGVPTGPRGFQWRPTEPATVLWAEALDGGNPATKVPHRDRLMMLKAPFADPPLEYLKTEERFAGIQFGDKSGMALVADNERARRWIRTFLIDANKPSEAPRLIWSRDFRDRYKDPGTPVLRTLANGHRAILESGDSIYLDGAGATPEGNRPFLDQFDLKTLKSERLFRSGAGEYEAPVALLDDAGTRFVTRSESPSEPPNYYIRTSGGGPRQALTKFPDPAPQLRDIRKQLVKYKRGDGVELSFTLYLPPGYKDGTRLPTVVWAYPLEFNDPATAGQVVGSPQRFTTISGMSHLFFLLKGYAVLDSATMPVVGDPKTVNDTYVEQIVSSAKAAIDKAAEMGVTDPNRVGVGGHSYGAFMTANLLAHSDLFRAGIARSGAYNRTLTPFGFQSERRTLWEAPETYIKMSPFMNAHKIKEPILLIHGEADNNSGTFPIQSDRMYQAVRGAGGKVRLVMLPHESHGYSARESIEHTLYEMISWFDKYVKDAPPRSHTGPSGSSQ